MGNDFLDAVFPVARVLRDVAEGRVFSGDSVGADTGASRAAMRRAKSNPSGIDMAAEAQKAAVRAGVAKAPAPAKRDHYKPRGQ